MLTLERQQANAEREIYLAEVTRHLTARLSPLEVYESVTELRDHIDAMVAAHEELGMDVALAMRQSLSKFGRPGHLGNSIGQASGQTKTQMHCTGAGTALPVTFGLTLVTTWAAAFALLNLCEFLFDAVFHGRPMGLPTSVLISFIVADIATIAAVFVPHKRSLAFAGWLTGIFNVIVGLSLYASYTYVNLGRAPEFALIVVSLSVSVYTLGVVASRAASHFERQFASKRVRS